MSDAHDRPPLTSEFIANELSKEDFFAPYESLIEAIERQLANSTLQAINPAGLSNDLDRFVVEQLQAELAKSNAIDVALIIRRSIIRFRMEELEADGLIEKTGELRASPITGELLPAYRLKHPIDRVVILDTDSKN